MSAKYKYIEKLNKLAVMGGTFDPIHYGHLAVAEAVLEEFSPQRVLFIPGGQPPHKPPVTDSEHRYQMTLLSICETPCFDISRIEIDRTGPSYTVDTITALREICRKDIQIFFIIGADALMEILSWHGAERLCKLCEFIAVLRPGYEIDKDYTETLREKYGAKIHILKGPALDISGTALREKLAQRKSVNGFMPKVAAEYAIKNALYAPYKTELTPERYKEVKARIKKELSVRRFRHTMGTVEEAEKLAKHYGADVTKARWAALLHDCAKEYSSAKKFALNNVWNIPLDDIMKAHIDITHSILGAEVARRHFYVQDEEVLQAIARHTMGYKNMTLLDKIIMLADYIEPCREDCETVSKMRKQAYRDINAALITGIHATNEDLKRRNRAIHPWCMDMLNTL